MPVSVAQGDPVELVTSTLTLGGAGGRSFAIGNITWIALAASTLTYTATATVGTRQPILKFLDAQGNEICRSVGSAQPGAGAQFRYPVGSDNSIYATNAIVSMPFPYPLLLPPGTVAVVQDAANIDLNDTAQLLFIYTQ